MSHRGDDRELHYRTFAMMVMFIALLLGSFIGFLAGLSLGKEQAIYLMEKGRVAEQTTVNYGN